MALIIETAQMFFDDTDNHALKNSLSKRMKESGFNQIAEVKNENGVVIGRTYQNQPKLLKGRVEDQNKDVKENNIFKFKASED